MKMVFKNGHTPWNKGKKESWCKGLTKETDERVRKRAEKLLGRPCAEETRKKIGEANKGHKGSLYWLGKKMTEKHRKKLSDAKKGKMPWNNGLKEKEFLSHFKNGNTWNKGLTKETDPRVKKYSELMTEIVRKQRLGKTLEEIHGAEQATIIRYKMHLNGLNIAKKQNKKNTDIEIILQNILKNQKIDFDTQINISNICISDIVLKSAKIAIFCDGEYWHNYPYGTERDKKQTKLLKNSGWKVLRFWGNDIKENPKECLDKIEVELNDNIT